MKTTPGGDQPEEGIYESVVLVFQDGIETLHHPAGLLPCLAPVND